MCINGATTEMIARTDYILSLITVPIKAVVSIALKIKLVCFDFIKMVIVTWLKKSDRPLLHIQLLDYLSFCITGRLMFRGDSVIEGGEGMIVFYFNDIYIMVD